MQYDDMSRNELIDALHRRDVSITELKTQARRDPLTKLSNRRGASKHLERAWKEGYPSILMLDIDRFKSLNDTYGHALGDRVLIGVSDILSGSVREGDVVCRWGGEEFLIVARDANHDEAWTLGERLRAAVASGHATGYLEVPVTVSVGVACGAWWNNIQGMSHAADVALYTSKENGRNRVTMAP